MKNFRRKSKGRSEDDIVGQWLVLGMCFGIALGAIFDNVGLGISLGMCFGAALGAVIGEKKKLEIADTKPDKRSLLRKIRR